MSYGHNEGPVYYREIQKNAYLKRIPNESTSSKLIPLGHKKPPLKPMWTQFCVHNGRAPYLEQYPLAESPATMSHKPVWRACLRTARHVTASVKPHTGKEYDFLVDTDDGPVRMLAPDWETMQDWVSTLRSKLHELRVLSCGENVYAPPPAPPPATPPVLCPPRLENHRTEPDSDCDNGNNSGNAGNNGNDGSGGNNGSDENGGNNGNDGNNGSSGNGSSGGSSGSGTTGPKKSLIDLGVGLGLGVLGNGGSKGSGNSGNGVTGNGKSGSGGGLINLGLGLGLDVLGNGGSKGSGNAGNGATGHGKSGSGNGLLNGGLGLGLKLL